MATIEICFPVDLPARLWETPGQLTEEGEAALNAVAAALDGSLKRGNARRALTAYGLSYTDWVTRWPGPAGDPYPASETEDPDAEEETP